MESTLTMLASVLKTRVFKCLTMINDNRQRIYRERMNHYLFKVNTKNKSRSKKWWAFLVLKKYKSPVYEAEMDLGIKGKLICKWGDTERLENLFKICVAGNTVNVTISDMSAVLVAEDANKWQSGATIKTEADIKNIWL